MMSNRPRVLIVDDKQDAGWALSVLMRTEGMTPLEAQDGLDALGRIRAESPDVVLLDIKMPGMDGMRVLKEVRKFDLITPVIMLTAHGTIELAVEATKGGAYDFLTKPFDNEDVVLTVRRALKVRALTGDAPPLPARPDPCHPLYRTMGSGECVVRLVDHIDRVADTSLSVLILGESGVGKELVARAIHERSGRARSKFIAVDCGSLPVGLVENELFGHQEGAYTGARTAAPGKFEAASRGTLFLDEIGSLPFSAQGALLRTFEERAVCRVGGVEPIKVDVRLLAATNQDVWSLIRAGKFRADLFHRLAEFELRISPLRERQEGLPFLAKRFLDEANQECNRSIEGLSAQALRLLQAYDWPGNVRELRNVIRRAVVLADTAIEPGHLAPLRTAGDIDPSAFPAEKQINDSPSLKEITKRAAAEAERHTLTNVLKQTGGNKAKAARILRVDYKTLHKKVKEYGIG